MNKLKLYLSGDSNINMNADYVESREFTAILEANGLFNAVRTPTRMSCESSTLLDLFITNGNLDNVTTGEILSDISDHFPIFSVISDR